jgi:hypothetical protein
MVGYIRAEKVGKRLDGWAMARVESGVLMGEGRWIDSRVEFAVYSCVCGGVEIKVR